MLLLRNEVGTEDGSRHYGRCADLKGAAHSGRATATAHQSPVHHVREQHGPRRL